MHYKFGGYMFNQTLVDRVENADPRYNVDRRALEQRWQKPEMWHFSNPSPAHRLQGQHHVSFRKIRDGFDFD